MIPVKFLRGGVHEFEHPDFANRRREQIPAARRQHLAALV